MDSSTIDDSDIDNDIQASALIKQNKESKINSNSKEKKVKNSRLIKTKIIGFIIFFILLIWQYASYIYYYLRLTNYKNCIHYEYHLTDYMSSFLFPFIAIREYIYEKGKFFYNIPVHQYIDKTLKQFYVELAQISDNKDKYVSYFPKSYTDYLNYLYSDKICELIMDFINKYPGNGYNNCDDFFYGTSDYGFFSILTTYIEEIRMLRDLVDDYNERAEERNFTYNESYFNDPNQFYEIYYNKFNYASEEYRNLCPANTLNTIAHKNAFIVYNFIISEVMTLALNELFNTFEGIFASTNKVSLIINFVFIAVVFIGFFFIWLPFVLEENETIFKTKNMLSIIPNEILITLPHINILLGIDEGNI